MTERSQPNSEAIERLIEDLLQTSLDYERAEKYDAKYRRKDLEDAKQAIRSALQIAPAQAAPFIGCSNSLCVYYAGRQSPAPPQAANSPQHIIEGIILRRIYEKRIEGYTIEMAKEIAEAIGNVPQNGEQTPPSWIDTAALQAAHEIVAIPESWTFTRRKAAIQVIVTREMMRYRCCTQPQEVREALELAEDVLSRRPFSTEIWPNGMHPQTGITKIREAIASLSRPKQG